MVSQSSRYTPILLLSLFSIFLSSFLCPFFSSSSFTSLSLLPPVLLFLLFSVQTFCVHRTSASPPPVLSHHCHSCFLLRPCHTCQSPSCPLSSSPSSASPLPLILLLLAPALIPLALCVYLWIPFLNIDLMMQRNSTV